MKKQISILSLFLSLVLLLSSCGKDEIKPPTVAFTYLVNPVSSQTVPVTGSSKVTVSTALLTGTSEAVTLNVKDVPQNVTISPSTVTGTPPFNTDFVITSTNAVSNTYPITIEATSASTQKQVYTFNLTVAPPVDCSASLVGTYNGPESCTIGSDNYAITITATGTTNKVMINNLYNAGVNAYAIIDCDAKTLTIPSQTINVGGMEVTVSGTGTYTSLGVKITYSVHVTSTGADNSCTINATKN